MKKNFNFLILVAFAGLLGGCYAETTLYDAGASSGSVTDWPLESMDLIAPGDCTDSQWTIIDELVAMDVTPLHNVSYVGETYYPHRTGSCKLLSKAYGTRLLMVQGKRVTENVTKEVAVDALRIALQTCRCGDVQ